MKVWRIFGVLFGLLFFGLLFFGLLFFGWNCVKISSCDLMCLGLLIGNIDVNYVSNIINKREFVDSIGIVVFSTWDFFLNGFWKIFFFFGVF